MAGEAIRFIEHVLGAGHAPYVVDRGSSPDFRRRLQSLDIALRIEPGSSAGAARRAAIEMASSDNSIIAWSEVERGPLIPFLERLVSPLSEADIVIPSRFSLDSFPYVQQLAEQLGNWLWRQYAGAPLDVFFGPHIWDVKLSDMFLRYDGRYGDRSDSALIPLLEIALSGEGMIDMPIHYTHPEEQFELEVGTKALITGQFQRLYDSGKALSRHYRSLAASHKV